MPKQVVQKVAIASIASRHGQKKAAKNSTLKQAAPTGRAPVKNPGAPSRGPIGVPTSVVALTPGSGPKMSSTPAPVGRGKPTGPTTVFPISGRGGRAGGFSSKPPKRGSRK